MFFLGQKGQAFSTFKLLIAAIVAVVILVILLSILGIINFSPRNQPIVGATDALKEAYQTKTLLYTSREPVTFTRDNSIITSMAIVERANVGLAEDQVCLSLGELTDAASLAGFKGNDEGAWKKIEYTAGGQRNVKFAVLCMEGKSIPDQVGSDQVGSGNTYQDIDEAWVENCPCVKDKTINKDICCVIMLKYAR
ncbi:MAG: hypothetical protein QXK06_00025 [Candidatus Diapherotrites archaeon]